MRIRVHYYKTDALRYTSILDMQRIWERLIRRTHLPLAYSQGFHPQPKIQQACPLALGFTSLDEIVDLFFSEDLDLEMVQNRLRKAAQPGLEIQNLEHVEDKAPTLQTKVTASDYEIIFLESVDPDDLKNRVAQILSTESILRERRGKQYDLRPLIFRIEVLDGQPNPRLSMNLSTRDGATGRPDEVLSAMGFDPYAARIERKRIQIAE